MEQFKVIKRTLWRANLYVNLNGAADWNSMNSWNAPLTDADANIYGEGNNIQFIPSTEKIWYGGNNWNRKPTDNTQGDGKQVVKPAEFTYVPKIVGGTGKDSVAYAYGCSDTPFEFNSKMDDQKELLGGKYTSNGNLKTAEATNSTSWSKRTAPETGEDYYNNYISNLDDFNIKTPASHSSVPTQVQTLGDNPFPYLPGYALQYFFTEKAEPPNWVNAISAGVDCNGFVSRSASYPENPYTWKDNNGQDITNYDKWFSSPGYPTTGRGDSYLITQKSDGVFDPLTLKYYWLNLDKIKPGDIMYYTENGKNKHIAMVQNVTKTDGVVTLSDIKLIESTWYEKNNLGAYKNAKVTNEQSLNNYETKSWYIIRLKRK